MKEKIKLKYGKIASNTESSCCKVSGCCNLQEITFADNYLNTEGYFQEADLGLGCGIPIKFANIKNGDIVVDLGSGAGNDCFVARAKVGTTGKVIGIDFTSEMIQKAKINNKKLGYENIEFLLGDIENIPLPDESADVVISNCVLNLIPDKKKAFSEIYRILKTNGHFCISDIVTRGKLPEKLKKDAELYAGCIAGAIPIEKYVLIIKESGFKNINIQQEKIIQLPSELLSQYLSEQEIKIFKTECEILSITIYAEKH